MFSRMFVYGIYPESLRNKIASAIAIFLLWQNKIITRLSMCFVLITVDKLFHNFARMCSPTGIISKSFNQNTPHQKTNVCKIRKTSTID